MRFPHKRLLPALVAIALAGGIVYSFLPQPITVDVGQVTSGPMRVTVDEDGRTRVKERYVVSAPLAGRMRRIDLEPGDPVKAGETRLAIIEPTHPTLLDPRTRAEMAARVESSSAAERRAAADVEAARQQTEFARAEFARAEKLKETGAISQREYDEAQTRVRTREEELQAANFALQTLRYEREQAQAALTRTDPTGDTTDTNWLFPVLPPIDGRVLRVLQKSATVVAPGTNLLEIGDPTSLEVEIDVLSSDAVQIRPGAQVLLEGWGGPHPLQARVRRVDPSGFLKVSALGVEEQRVWVIADFLDPLDRRPTLGDNYRVDARIVTWNAGQVVKAPAGALFRQGQHWAVFVIRDGRAALRMIDLDHINGIEAEILQGLDPGERVILHPGDKVNDGTRVLPRPPSP